MEKQHRKLERKNLVYFPEVIETDTGKKIGRIIDVTTEGFLIVGDNPIAEGTIYKATVNWVDEFRKETDFSCTIDIVWCKQDVNPSYNAMGCKIKEISTENKESIKRLIRKWGFPSWK